MEPSGRSRDRRLTESESLALPGTIDDIRSTRRAVAEVLARAATPAAVAEDTLLCASELVTNAVLHAGGPIRVEIEATHQAVLVAVSDPVPADDAGLSTLAATRRGFLEAGRELDRSTGRGLVIVAELASRWGVDAAEVQGRDGKRVWVELRHEASARRQAVDVRSHARPTHGAPATTVTLAGVPIRLVLASEAHLDALVRELHLLAIGGSLEARRFLRGLARALGRGRAQRTVVLELALRLIEKGEPVMTAELAVAAWEAAELVEYLAVVELGEALARRHGALESGVSDEVARFRRWFVAELDRQANGGEALPCPFPA